MMVDKTAFFAALKKCSSGERAALKSNCGKTIHEADGKALMIFYRHLPYSVPQRDEGFWFTAACFSCLWDSENVGRPVENVLAELAETYSSMNCRLAAILDLTWDTDGYLLEKLFRIMKMARSKGLAVDCEKLLDDLIYWNSKNQSVQRKWAKALYANKPLE